ncbi:hypothetical protein CB1_002524028 [Camelus ferus]|nr:hypothetical protein CB1_002524028 [Camelus ferus]
MLVRASSKSQHPASGLMSSYIQLWIRRKLFLWFPTPLANARSVCKILLFFLSSPLEEPQWIELQKLLREEAEGARWTGHRSPRLCRLHRGQFNLFCLEDKELLCCSCQADPRHQGHRVQPVKDTAHDYRPGGAPAPYRNKVWGSDDPMFVWIKLRTRAPTSDPAISAMSGPRIQGQGCVPQHKAKCRNMEHALREKAKAFWAMRRSYEAIAKHNQRRQQLWSGFQSPCAICAVVSG